MIGLKYAIKEANELKEAGILKSDYDRIEMMLFAPPVIQFQMIKIRL